MADLQQTDVTLRRGRYNQIFQNNHRGSKNNGLRKRSRRVETMGDIVGLWKSCETPPLCRGRHWSTFKYS